MTILSYYNFGKYLQRIKKDNGIFSNMKRDKFMKRLNSWIKKYKM
jgi:predicted component of type VI protein secretion system